MSPVRYLLPNENLYREMLHVCHLSVTFALQNENLYRGKLHVCRLSVTCVLQNENLYPGMLHVCHLPVTCVLQNENLYRGVLRSLLHQVGAAETQIGLRPGDLIDYVRQVRLAASLCMCVRARRCVCVYVCVVCV